MSEKISELPSFSGGSLPSTAKIPVSIDGVTYKAQPSTFGGGGGSVGNLQQVTDNGKTTTNRIELQRLSDGEDVVILDNESDEVGHIQILDPDTGKKNIFDPNIIQMYKNGSISTTITNENITSDLELQIPNKSGVKVIATVDDISGKEDSSNKVTTFTGNTTSTTKFPVVKAIVDWVNSLGFITNVATALGYTPANKAGETFTGAITATNLSGSNTGDQDLSGLVPKTTTVNSKALSSNITLTTADIADSTNKRYQTDNQNTYNDATSSIQTQLNGKQSALGYTAENTANKSTDVNADQTSNTKYSTPKSIYDWVTGLFATKSMGAYSFRVNNTNATANATETTYKSVAEQSFSPTVTWGGTTSPSGTLTANYSWEQIGIVCISRFNLIYTSAGSANTSAYFALPSDMPAPYIPSGFSGASAILYIGVGNFNTSLTTAATASYKAFIRRNSANNGFEVFVTGTGVNALVLNASITYLTA